MRGFYLAADKGGFIVVPLDAEGLNPSTAGKGWEAEGTPITPPLQKPLHTLGPPIAYARSVPNHDAMFQTISGVNMDKC